MKFDPKLIKIRGALVDDAPFILNSWLKSYRNSGPAAAIPNLIYFQFHGDHIKTILQDEHTVVLVMVNSQDETQIMGYLVMNASAPILHFVYVKQPFRKFGIGQLLLSAARQHHTGKTLHCTHIARQWGKLSSKFNLVYNPYILSGTLNEQPPQSSPVETDQAPLDQSSLV